MKFRRMLDVKMYRIYKKRGVRPSKEGNKQDVSDPKFLTPNFIRRII